MSKELQVMKYFYSSWLREFSMFNFVIWSFNLFKNLVRFSFFLCWILKYSVWILCLIPDSSAKKIPTSLIYSRWVLRLLFHWGLWAGYSTSVAQTLVEMEWSLLYDHGSLPIYHCPALGREWPGSTSSSFCIPRNNSEAFVFRVLLLLHPELGVVREVQSRYPRFSEHSLKSSVRVRKNTGIEHTRSSLMWREILPDGCHLSTQGASFSALKMNSLRERHSLKNLLNNVE